MRRTHRQTSNDNRAVMLALVIIALSLIGMFAVFAGGLAHDQGNLVVSKNWHVFVVMDMVLVAILALYAAATNRN